MAGNSHDLGQFLARRAERIGGRSYAFVRWHWLGIINFHLFVFVTGAPVAPLLWYLNQDWMSKMVYAFYGLFCHQKASRSFFLLENQVAICARCLSFYCSLLFLSLWTSLRRLRPIDLKLALILIAPAALDVLSQTLRLRESTNLLRVTTGALLGMSAGLYLLPRAKKAMEHLPDEVEHVRVRHLGGTKVGNHSR
ncbi:MAG: DUF2085 domain-containing protein [Candidatus Zixiibacteriota bacterium]